MGLRINRDFFARGKFYNLIFQHFLKIIRNPSDLFGFGTYHFDIYTQTHTWTGFLRLGHFFQFKKFLYISYFMKVIKYLKFIKRCIITLNSKVSNFDPKVDQSIAVEKEQFTIAQLLRTLLHSKLQLHSHFCTWVTIFVSTATF